MKTIQLPEELYRRAAAQVEPGRSVEEQIIAWLTEAVIQQEATAQFFRARRTGRPREEAAASGRALLLQLAERQQEAQAEGSTCEA
jgi:hypothetical protein